MPTNTVLFLSFSYIYVLLFLPCDLFLQNYLLKIKEMFSPFIGDVAEITPNVGLRNLII